MLCPNCFQDCELISDGGKMLEYQCKVCDNIFEIEKEGDGHVDGND